MERRKDHDTRRLLGHALIIRRHGGVDLAAAYCRFMGVQAEDAARVLARRTLTGSYR